MRDGWTGGRDGTSKVLQEVLADLKTVSLSSVSKHLVKYILETHVTVYHLVVNCLSFSIIFVGFPGVLLLINFRKSSLLIRLKSDHCLHLSTHAHFPNMNPSPSFFSGGSAQLT